MCRFLQFSELGASPATRAQQWGEAEEVVAVPPLGTSEPRADCTWGEASLADLCACVLQTARSPSWRESSQGISDLG